MLSWLERMILILRQVKKNEFLCKESITRFFWLIVILVVSVHLSVKVKNKTKLSSSQLFWLCDSYSVTETSNKERQQRKSWRLKFTAGGCEGPHSAQLTSEMEVTLASIAGTGSTREA